MYLKNFFTIIFILIFFSGCQTIKEKSDAVVDKENKKYGKLVGKEISDLKIELGNPTEDYVNEQGNRIFLYKTKKYGIPCERKFEVNSSGVIVAFSSSGCI